jgi:HK97 family phage prohead protease
MADQREILVSRIRNYAESGEGQITTAAEYFGDLVRCVRAGGSCPTKAIQLDGDLEKAIKQAQEKLVYSNLEQKVLEFESGKAANSGKSGKEGYILKFDGRMSTKDLDRDGDILEPQGMLLVENMPLLWQHNHSQPVGVMIKTLEQNEKYVDNQYGLLDIPLARDAAVLVKGGALRLSHGFDPYEAEPIDTFINHKGEEVPTGWHITEMEVYETSLVSVPANAKAKILRVNYQKQFEAVCDLYGKSFETDLVKNYVGNVYEKRVKVFKGWSPESDSREPEPKKEKAVKSVSESADVKVVKSLSMAMGSSTLEGSYERMLENVREAVYEKYDDDYDEYCSMVATFEDSVVFAKYNYKKRECKSYRAGFSWSEGKVMLSEDEPTEVQVKASVMEKVTKRLEARARKRFENDGAGAEEGAPLLPSRPSILKALNL